MKLSFEVQQGIVHVNSIKVLRATKDVVLISADFKNKYPECRGIIGSLVRVLFGAGEGTLDVEDREADPTEILVSGFHPSWYDPEDKSGLKFDDVKYYIDMGRYCANICWVYTKPSVMFGYWDNGSES